MDLNQSVYMRKSHYEVTKCNVKRSLVGEYNSCEGGGCKMTWAGSRGTCHATGLHVKSDSTELPSRIPRRTQTFRLHIREIGTDDYYVNATLSVLGPGFYLS